MLADGARSTDKVGCLTNSPPTCGGPCGSGEAVVPGDDRKEDVSRPVDGRQSKQGLRSSSVWISTPSHGSGISNPTAIEDQGQKKVRPRRESDI